MQQPLWDQPGMIGGWLDDVGAGQTLMAAICRGFELLLVRHYSNKCIEFAATRVLIELS